MFSLYNRKNIFSVIKRNYQNYYTYMFGTNKIIKQRGGIRVL